MKRLAIVTSHPIQYNAPWFKLLTDRKNIAVKIFYTWGESVLKKKFDPGFGKVIDWDIPLLQGYDYTFVNNISTEPGTHHFKGIINPTLNKEIEDWKADAVLVFGWSFSSHLKCLRYFHKKIPVLFRGDSTLIDETGGVKTFLRRFFLKWVYHYVDHALYVGTNNKNYFLKHGLKEKQLIHAPHAIDNDRFAEPDEYYTNEAIKWRQNLGIGSNDIVLLFAGKFENKKDPFLFLQLAKRIQEPKLKFVLAGNGVLENELRLEAKEDTRIKFVDFINQQQMPVIYRVADVFILPSKGPGETWGLALNEAMACGKAVVSTYKVGGAIDLIKNGENGFIVEPNDIDDLQKRINSMGQDSIKKMGQNSSLRIKEFSFKKIVKAIEVLVTTDQNLKF